MIDFKHKTAFKYAEKYKGRNTYKMSKFPYFDKNTFPLLLIKE